MISVFLLVRRSPKKKKRSLITKLQKKKKSIKETVNKQQETNLSQPTFIEDEEKLKQKSTH